MRSRPHKDLEDELSRGARHRDHIVRVRIIVDFNRTLCEVGCDACGSGGMASWTPSHARTFEDDVREAAVHALAEWARLYPNTCTRTREEMAVEEVMGA